MRLQKFLSQAGVCSRRHGEDLIMNGRVTVNGEVITEMGFIVDPAKDTVAADGCIVQLVEKFVYVLLHKPAGYVTTMHDPQGRPTVIDLINIKDGGPRICPVGRLDMDTTGVLLLTNDGELANLLTHPSHGVEKEYIAAVKGVPESKTIARLKSGVMLEDGPARAARAKLVKQKGQLAIISIVLKEGRKRQVKRMLQKVGMPVVRLHRSHFGFLCLDDLKEGAWRFLTKSEVKALYNITGLAK